MTLCPAESMVRQQAIDHMHHLSRSKLNSSFRKLALHPSRAPVLEIIQLGQQSSICISLLEAISFLPSLPVVIEMLKTMREISLHWTPFPECNGRAQCNVTETCIEVSATVSPSERNTHQAHSRRPATVDHPIDAYRACPQLRSPLYGSARPIAGCSSVPERVPGLHA